MPRTNGYVPQIVLCDFLSYTEMRTKYFSVSQDKSIPIHGNLRSPCDGCHGTQYFCCSGGQGRFAEMNNCLFSVRSCPAPALNEAEILWKNLPSHPATIGCTQGWAGLGLYKCKLIFPWGRVLHSVVRLCVEAFPCRNICGWWSEVSFNGSIIFSQKLTYLTQNTYTEMHTHTYFSCKAMWCFILNPLNLGFYSAFPSPPQRAHLCCWGGLCKRITHRGGFCYHRGRSRQGICNYEDRKYKPLRQECSGDQLHSCSPGKRLQ